MSKKEFIKGSCQQCGTVLKKKHIGGKYVTCPKCNTNYDIEDFYEYKQPCTFEAAVKKIAKIITTQYKSLVEQNAPEKELDDEIVMLISDACGEVQAHNGDAKSLYNTMDFILHSLIDKKSCRCKHEKIKPVFVHYHHPGSGYTAVCDDGSETDDSEVTTNIELVNCPKCREWLKRNKAIKDTVLKPKRKYVRKTKPATEFIHYRVKGAEHKAPVCQDENYDPKQFKVTTVLKRVNCPDCRKWIEANTSTKAMTQPIQPKPRMSE